MHPELKAIAPFLSRAKELQEKEPVISYYCQLYAVQLGIEIPQKSKEASVFLMNLMDTIEQLKTDFKDNETVTSEIVGKAFVENFALNVFHRTDSLDREGKADKTVALSFLAASNFLQVLQVFGPLDSEISEMMKYARFKAADIMKALKEGRTPTAGPVVKELQVDPTTQDDHSPSSSLIQEPAFPKIPETLKQRTESQEPPQESDIGKLFDTDFKAFTLAQKHAKFAVSAIQYQDVGAAIENLQKAIDLLKPLQ